MNAQEIYMKLISLEKTLNNLIMSMNGLNAENAQLKNRVKQLEVECGLAVDGDDEEYGA